MRGTCVVPREEGVELRPSSARDQHEFELAGVLLQPLRGHPADPHLATAFGEGGQPGRHLDALIDRLRGLVEPGLPVPEVDAQRAFPGQRGVEHALVREEPAGADRFGVAVGGHGDGVPVAPQA
ncbi:MAG TPA: hypothetical protein VFG15_15500 [Amycolatopsis sp.]|nr:hypothetical protein [Amycolatopsis sp.]